MLKLSIVIPTLGRKTQLVDLLNSIKETRVPNFDVIIVDQNDSGYIDEIVSHFIQSLPIKHIRSKIKSVSNARNIGAKESRSEYLCFPDDDSMFFKETILNAINNLTNQSVNVVFGKTINEHGEDSIIKYEEMPGYLTKRKHSGMFVENTMFINRLLFLKYQFDESFGIGAFYGAEEGYDLVLRLLKDDERIYYDPLLTFYHPSKVIDYQNIDTIMRVFNYRKGFSHLCIKHHLYLKLAKRIFQLIPYILLLAVKDRKKIRYYTAELLGILTGIVIR